MRLVRRLRGDAGPRPEVLGPGDAARPASHRRTSPSGRAAWSARASGAAAPLARHVQDDLVPEELERHRRRERVAHVGDEDQAGQPVEPGLVGPPLARQVRPARTPRPSGRGRGSPPRTSGRIARRHAAEADVERPGVAGLPLRAPDLAAVAAHRRVDGRVAPLDLGLDAHGGHRLSMVYVLPERPRPVHLAVGVMPEAFMPRRTASRAGRRTDPPVGREATKGREEVALGPPVTAVQTLTTPAWDGRLRSSVSSISSWRSTTSGSGGGSYRRRPTACRGGPRIAAATPRAAPCGGRRRPSSPCRWPSIQPSTTDSLLPPLRTPPRSGP